MENISGLRLFDVATSRGTDVLFETLKKGDVIRYRADQIDKYSDRLAIRLMQLKLNKGDYIMTLLKDGPTWNIAENAILKAGGIHVPLSATSDTARLINIANALQPKMIIVETTAIEKRVHSILVKASIFSNVVNVTNEMSEVINVSYNDTKLEAVKRSVMSDDVAVVLFTSGTTSSFKGAILSHKSVLVASNEFGKSDAFSEISRTLSVLPMSHSAARKVNYACQINGVIICYAAPSLSTLNNINRFKVQHMATVPYMLKELWQEIKSAEDSTCSLKKVNCGGAPLPERTWELLEEMQIKVYEVYGLTETASLLSYSTDSCRRPNCVGRKAKNIECRISTTGELEVRGPTLLSAYINKDGTVTQAVDNNGWFSTGDAIAIDSDGGFKVVGRLNRSYKSQRGNHIFPDEVEKQLISLDHIEQAFVVNDPRKSLEALIVPTEGVTTNVAVESIRNYNRKASDDLMLERVAVIEQSQLTQLNLKGQLKPNSFTINELIKNLEFIKT